MMRLIVILFLFLTITEGYGQELDFNLRNEVYFDHIKSVQLIKANAPASDPILDLNRGGRLLLSFDDMGGDRKDYRYSIFHCTKDWDRSDLEEVEYLEGFNEELIDNYSTSSNTREDYTHYRLILPNEDTRWTLSGNYILVIYEDESEMVPVLTRRFMIVEQSVAINSQSVKPSMVDKIRTHHELDFSIDYKNFSISNPLNDITVTLVQNGNWPNAIKNLKPKYFTSNKLHFDYIDRLNFHALKEFRSFDTRSLYFASEYVKAIELNDEGADVLLELGRSRHDRNYLTQSDLNGKHVLASKDQAQTSTRSEYAYVIFSLDIPEIDQDIYITGEFTDWLPYESCRMVYDNYRGIYLREMKLKQGYYDYMYGVEKEGKWDLVQLEGSWYETENDYNFFVYYSPFGSRYDRLIGVSTVNSNR